jgi:hypothetical protein
VTIYIANSTVVDIASPAWGDTLTGYGTVIGTAMCPRFSKLTVELGRTATTNNWQLIQESSSPACQSEIVTWVAGNLPMGEYVLRLSVFSNDDRVGSSVVKVFLNSPFAEPNGWRISLGSDASIIPNYGDFDNDGICEIVVGTSDGIRFFNPDGTEKTTGIPMLPDYDFRVPIAVGELDGDGIDDFVAVGSNPATIYCVRSSAPTIEIGGIHPPNLWRYEYTDYLEWPLLSLRDIDNDGLDEIHYWPGSDAYSKLEVHIFGTTGEQAEFERLQGAYLTAASCYLVDDIDGDMIPEIYSMGGEPYKGHEHLIKSNTAGKELRRVSFTDDFERHFTAKSLSAVDVDGDQRRELVLLGRFGNVPANYSNYLLYIFDKNLELLKGFPHDTGINGFYSPRGPVFGDLDGDGLLEYVVSWWDLWQSYVSVWNQDGTAFAGGHSIDGLFASSPDPSMLSFPGIADIDGDRQAEIIMSQAPAPLSAWSMQSIVAWRSDGQVVAGWPLVAEVGVRPFSWFMHAPVVGDIDRDGAVDVIMTTHRGDLVFTEFSDAIYDSNAAYCPFYRYNRRMNSLAPMRCSPYMLTIDDGPTATPRAFAVGQNYPNPFNAQTTIEFSLRKEADVCFRVFNILGQTVASIDLGKMLPGPHSLTWTAEDDTGDDLPSGIYFYRIRAADEVETKKMLLLK